MIWIKNLTKRFDKRTVLDNVTLALRESTITALLGPNASGKSTLIKCALGMVNPDAGEIYIGDEPVLGQWRYRDGIGYMPQLATFPENLRTGELLDLLKDVRGRETGLDLELWDRFGLDAVRHQRLGTLSGGTRQKILAVVAFLFDPDILILDEPTVGLDPVSATLLKDKIRGSRDAGKTVLLCSHIVSDVEELADHIVYLLEGKPMYDGGIADLKRATAETRLDRAIVRLVSTPQPHAADGEGP